VIVTLFDWQDGVSPPGSAEEGYELSYLRTIVDAFKMTTCDDVGHS
jgi:hypothetical protein